MRQARFTRFGARVQAESNIMIDPFTPLRLERGTQHLYALRRRAIAGFLEDLTARIGGMLATLGLPAEDERKLTPGMIVTAGGDRWTAARMRHSTSEPNWAS